MWKRFWIARCLRPYKQVKDAILESRLVAADSRFAKRALAHKLGGLPEAPRPESKFTLLRQLVRIAH
jgi:hypothetical protein